MTTKILIARASPPLSFLFRSRSKSPALARNNHCLLCTKAKVGERYAPQPAATGDCCLPLSGGGGRWAAWATGSAAIAAAAAANDWSAQVVRSARASVARASGQSWASPAKREQQLSPAGKARSRLLEATNSFPLASRSPVPSQAHAIDCNRGRSVARRLLWWLFSAYAAAAQWQRNVLPVRSLVILSPSPMRRSQWEL